MQLCRATKLPSDSSLLIAASGGMAGGILAAITCPIEVRPQLARTYIILCAPFHAERPPCCAEQVAKCALQAQAGVDAGAPSSIGRLMGVGREVVRQVCCAAASLPRAAAAATPLRPCDAAASLPPRRQRSIASTDPQLQPRRRSAQRPQTAVGNRTSSPPPLSLPE